MFVTPTAREYLRDRGISLVVDKAPRTAMTRTPVPDRGDYTFVDAVTGMGYRTKPEDMTHLRGNLLVAKTHPRIALRGMLDGLQASILLLQARYPGERALCTDLDSALAYVGAVLGAEVKEEPMKETLLFGLGEEEIRRMSHDVRTHFGMDHPIPSASMGVLALELNYMRTRVREAELWAARAFPEGDSLGIIKHLNRLSSGIYILFCRVVSGKYGGDGKSGSPSAVEKR